MKYANKGFIEKIGNWKQNQNILVQMSTNTKVLLAHKNIYGWVFLCNYQANSDNPLIPTTRNQTGIIINNFTGLVKTNFFKKKL